MLRAAPSGNHRRHGTGGQGERYVDVTERALRSGQFGRDGNGARELAGSASGRSTARARGPVPRNQGSSNFRFGASIGSADASGVPRFGGQVRTTGAITPPPRDDGAADGSHETHGSGAHERDCSSPQTRRHLPTGGCGCGGGAPRWVGGGAPPHHPAPTVVGVWRGFGHCPCHPLSPIPCCQWMRAERKRGITGKDTSRRWGVTPCGRQRRRVGPPAAAAPAPAFAARARAERGNSKAPPRRRRPGLVRLPPSLSGMITGLIPPRPPVRPALSAVDRLPAGCETGAAGDPRYPPLGCATALEREAQYDGCSVFSPRNVVLLLLGSRRFSMGAARHLYPEQEPRAFLFQQSIHLGA